MSTEVATLAPWGEAVVDEGPLTIDDLLALPDDGRMYELVEGRLIRMVPGGGEASYLGMRIGAAIVQFADPLDLGIVTGADGTFNLTRPGERDTGLVPDVAFVLSDRVPPRDSPDHARAWRLGPDLVVEIASPSQSRPKLAAKVRRYLAAGVRLVWVVWPKRRQVDVWRPGDERPGMTLGIGDTLDGADVLPGFSYPLERLFH